MFVNGERGRGEGAVEGGYSPFLLHWDVFFPPKLSFIGWDNLVLIKVWIALSLHFPILLSSSPHSYAIFLLQPLLWTA